MVAFHLHYRIGQKLARHDVVACCGDGFQTQADGEAYGEYQGGEGVFAGCPFDHCCVSLVIR